MFVYSSSHILMKLGSVALLAVVSPFYLGLYFLADMGLFFLYKLVRRDLTYWVNIPSQAKSIFISCILRVTMKCVVDFTVFLQGRHAFEMGGLYWVANLFLAQSSCYVFAYLYVVSDVSDKLSPELIMGAIVALQFIFLLSFGRFLTTINRKYLSTFLGTVRGCDYLAVCFNDPDSSDLVKFDIAAEHHPFYYWRIRGAMKVWYAENWQRFVDEKPEWFVKKASRLPPDLIPRGADSDVSAISSAARENVKKSVRVVRRGNSTAVSSRASKIEYVGALSQDNDCSHSKYPSLNPAEVEPL